MAGAPDSVIEKIKTKVRRESINVVRIAALAG